MAIRDKMRESARTYLRPTETVHAVFAGQTASQYVIALSSPFGALGVLLAQLLTSNRYRIFAVTNERILVLDAGKWSMKKARGIVAELPRSTRVGPASGLWHPITVDGKTVRVNRRFFKDIEAADATAAGSA
jgi:hypothetical protein